MAALLNKCGFYWQLRCANYGIRERWADKKQSVILIKTLRSELKQTLSKIYLFSTFEMYSNRTWAVLTVFSPVHQVRRGHISRQWKHLQYLIITFFLNRVYAKCAPPSQHSRLCFEGERDQMTRVRHMGYWLLTTQPTLSITFLATVYLSPWHIT
jgi:hypothetical protein